MNKNQIIAEAKAEAKEIDLAQLELDQEIKNRDIARAYARRIAAKKNKWAEMSTEALAARLVAAKSHNKWDLANTLWHVIASRILANKKGGFYIRTSSGATDVLSAVEYGYYDVVVLYFRNLEVGLPCPLLENQIALEIEQSDYKIIEWNSVPQMYI